APGLSSSSWPVAAVKRCPISASTPLKLLATATRSCSACARPAHRHSSKVEARRAAWDITGCLLGMGRTCVRPRERCLELEPAEHLADVVFEDIGFFLFTDAGVVDVTL